MGHFAALVAVLALVVPAAAVAAFPGSDPGESPRLNTPDDPDFDRCESDDEDGTRDCTSVFDEEHERFGFAPEGTENSATYHNPDHPHTQRLMAQNQRAGRNPLGQVSGYSADVAWKFGTGSADTEIAILDTGIRWSSSELRDKISLNSGELPPPKCSPGAAVPEGDCDGNGALNVDDFSDDPRVSAAAGNDEADHHLDGSDLLAAFSEGTDADANGYVDDIVGWDFFDDDNDPYDASSYSSASNHGSGRAEEAAAETNNAIGGTGVCPDCQFVPIRVWDTFVVDTNNFAQGVLYAADNGIEVVEGAVGGLSNTDFARRAFAHAYDKGTFMALVSSDLNTADHNYPTNYDESMYVAGAVADVHGLGENPPQGFIDFLNEAGIPLTTNAPVGTWFRNSGTTQYGGHAHVVMVGPTGSQNTGQAAGAAGLIASYGRERALAGELQGGPLEPNEIKQLMTMTAEDVVPENTLGLGLPDPALDGWDQHFGYGRVDLGLAMEKVRDGEIPPQALITSPDWFAPLNLERQGTVQVGGRLSAHRSTGISWQLQWAPGIEPAESEFRSVPGATGDSAVDGPLGSIDLEQVRDALDDRVASCAGNAPGAPPVATGGGTCDPTAPGRGPGDVDPNEPAFTVRLVVTDADGDRAEDRKVMFAYRDASLHDGWSRPVGGEATASGEATSGGEAAQRMYDLDGDNRLELIEATSSGELHVLRADGTPLESFNGGEPVRTLAYPNAHPASPSAAAVGSPRETLRTPAIGDIDGDLEPEIVDAAGEHVYAWEADGSPVAGFPVRLDPALSEVPARTRVNHIKRGFVASPTLGNLDADPELEIVEPALDQHVYAWNGDGSPVAGFPLLLRERDASGRPIPCSSSFECAEIINNAAVGDIDGDPVAEIVVPTHEFDDNPSAPGQPDGPDDVASALRAGATNILANAIGGSGRVYALDRVGDAAYAIKEGWPTKPNGAVPDALPFVGPGVDHALGDLDGHRPGGDAALEVIGNLASGDVAATDGDGSNLATYDPSPPSGENAADKSKVLNLFETAIVADLDEASPGPEVLKGGVTLNQLLNIGVAVGQNLPYYHLLQAWSGDPGASGASLAAFPQAVEDFQLLSSPAVADVAESPGAEAIVGTGLYLIRAINAQGLEASGWPKFTGGWNFAVPAIGDVDGDSKLEVATTTREGFSFLWETDAEACGGNEEWWTSRHDEWSSGAYGTDSRPPGTAEALSAEYEPGAVSLSWAAPGDDWHCGRAARYRVLAADGPIDSPEDGRVVGEGDASSGPGEPQTHEVTRASLRNARHLAVLYRDEAGNWGRLATVALTNPAGKSAGAADDAAPPSSSDGGALPAPPAGPCSNPLVGGRKDDRLVGTAGPDRLRSRGGDDRLRSLAGEDCATPGRGRDRVDAGEGADRVAAADEERDRIFCGPGHDTVIADPADRLRGCEEVERR